VSLKEKRIQSYQLYNYGKTLMYDLFLTRLRIVHMAHVGRGRRENIGLSLSGSQKEDSK